MPRNGSGTMTLVHDWTADEAAGIDIEASRFDAQHEDIRDEITNSVAKDGQTTMTGNLKMGSNKVTGVAAGTAADDAATLRQAQSGASAYGADTGSANAYAVAPAPAYTAYVTGMVVRFKAANANTGASTLNVNGLGAKDLKKEGGTDLEADDILANSIIQAVYDGTNFEITPIVQVPTQGIELISTATASNDATIDFTGLTGYESYLLFFDGLVPATDGEALYLRASTNNGSSYPATASDYKYSRIINTSQNTTVSASSIDGNSQIILATAIGSGTAESASGKVHLQGAASSSLYSTIIADVCCFNASAYVAQERTCGAYFGATSAVNAIRLLMSSGNISAGNFQLYGVKS